MSDDWAALLRSGRVSAKTRAALQERGAPDAPDYQPRALSRAALRTLRAVLARILPGSGIDLAARLDSAMAAGKGDGWRFDTLPNDVQACRAGLATLDAAAGGDFAALSAAAQDGWLTVTAAGEIPPGALDAAQMTRWFEDLRGTAVRVYVSHPATLARIGYSGSFYAGDGPDKPGFTDLVNREAWEPMPAA